MACLVVPMAEAIAVTVVKVILEKKEQKSMVSEVPQAELSSSNKISWSRKLGWLSKLLWGGVLLLALEHIWHGEIVAWPPFLTAMYNPEDVAPMLHEIATIGTSMAVFVTAVWGFMVSFADQKVKRIVSKTQKVN